MTVHRDVPRFGESGPRHLLKGPLSYTWLARRSVKNGQEKGAKKVALPPSATTITKKWPFGRGCWNEIAR